jgi:hypothetical protein
MLASQGRERENFMKSIANHQIETGGPNRLRRGLISLLVLLLVSAASLAAVFPLRVTASSVPDDRFSSERAMVHLPVIASEPHPQGSPAQALVRDYLVEQLTAMGVEVDVQRTAGLDNVVARLPGADPTGAILILAHYDSAIGSPGAGDNGSGVAALLEVMRALSAGTVPRNDIIVLFDDGEELPDPYSGARAFVHAHPWMADVRVAISLDTAVAGTISTNEVGPNNGWLVDALAQAYTGGAWTSFSGGGNYDTTPFRQAGVLVLALEDNYPFKEKHTSTDLPQVVRPASVQQMGEQTLSITRELGSRDLESIWGNQQAFTFILGLALIHYPEAWSFPLAIAAGVLLIVAFGLSLWRKFASWRGQLTSFGTILVTTVITVVAVSLLQPVLPRIFHWKTSAWPDWPEVIPPGGWIPVIVFYLLALGLGVLGYLLARRWSRQVDYSLAGLVPFLLPAIALSVATPRAAYAFLWPVIIGSLAWIAAAALGRKHWNWSADLAATLVALPPILLLLPFLPGVVMADGMKSLNILVGVETLMLGLILPAIDGLLVHRKTNLN